MERHKLPERARHPDRNPSIRVSERRRGAAPGRERRYRNYPWKRGREGKRRVNEPRGKGPLTGDPNESTTTPRRRVAYEERRMSLRNARAADCGGGLSRFTEQLRPELQKAFPREHVLHPFQLTRRHGEEGRSGVVDKGGEYRAMDKDNNRLCLMAWVAYRRSVDTPSGVVGGLRLPRMNPLLSRSPRVVSRSHGRYSGDPSIPRSS